MLCVFDEYVEGVQAMVSHPMQITEKEMNEEAGRIV